jgi:hypothetical protein
MCDNRLGLPFLYFRVAAEDTHPHPQIEIVIDSEVWTCIEKCVIKDDGGVAHR